MSGDEKLVILGSVTAYTPSRSGTDLLPGLMVADDVSWGEGINAPLPLKKGS